MGAIDLDSIRVAPIMIGDHAGDEGAIRIESVEAARAAQHQCLIVEVDT